MSKRARKRAMRFDPLHISWPLWVVSISAIIFLIAPVLLLIPMSLGSAEIIEFPPSKIGIDQYRKFFNHPAWQTAVLNSLQVAVGTSIVSTTIGLLASLALVWGRFKGKGFINASRDR